MDIGIIAGIVRAKRPLRLPVVLTPDEVRAVLRFLEGEVLLLCRILYGSGMRLLEVLRLRVKDVDFARHEITVRNGKVKAAVRHAGVTKLATPHVFRHHADCRIMPSCRVAVVNWAAVPGLMLLRSLVVNAA